VLEAEGGIDWNLFTFVPATLARPFKFRLPAGAEAFMLHGIIAAQPEITARADMVDGDLSVIINVAPNFAEEYHFEEDGMCLFAHVQVRRETVGYAHPAEDDSGFGSNLAAEPGVVKNHHPVYAFIGRLADPA
jgi:hypothetical protein